jgi:putative membrane protein
VSDPTPPPPGPRVILEEEERRADPRPAAPRLDFGWEQAVVPAAAAKPAAGRGWSGLARLAAGAGILILGLSALDVANFVIEQFDRGPALGWATLGVAVAGFGLIASAGWREMTGLFALRSVDRGRAAFARGDLKAAKAEALRWAAGVEEVAPLQPAIRDARSLEELRGLLLAGPLRALESRAAALGRNAAVQAFAVSAVSPSPGLDAVVFAWRGVRLVRQVAALHGIRPGVAATWALLRRTLFDAATVAATDIAVDTAARALLTSPILRHVAGETAAGAVAARRMLRLARAAAEACRVVPPG